MASTGSAAKQPSTQEQQERIAELYESRQVPEEKKRAPENFTKLSAARWINLLESYALKVEGEQPAEAKPKAPRTRARKGQPATETSSGYSGSGNVGGNGTAKPAARKSPRTRKPATAPVATRKTKTAAEPAPKAKATTSKQEPDRATITLAKKVMTMRDRDQLSWLKIGAACNLAPDAASPKAGASRARTLYRMVKGQDADTGPLPK